jgi:starch synthase (maltosyl-transferring)
VFALDGGIARLRDVTPGRPQADYRFDAELVVEPLGSRLLVAEHRDIVPPPALQSGPSQRLRKLAANRVVIERVTPEIDGGRFPAKAWSAIPSRSKRMSFATAMSRSRRHSSFAMPGARLARTADDAHRQRPLERQLRGRQYRALSLFDRGLARSVPHLAADTDKKHKAGQPVALEVIEGTEIIRSAAAKARGSIRRALQALLDRLAEPEGDTAARLAILMSDETAAQVAAARHRLNVSSYDKQLELVVDRRLGSFGAWYEMMPRSQSGDAKRHGTFDDVIAKLPYVRDLGFDVLYFTPIHPIGRTNRKGRNNTLTPAPDDPGSPYAIGSEEGGHDAIHPELGTFRGLRPAGRRRPRARARDRARLRHPVLAGPPLDQGAPGVVRLAPRRHHQVRREPAEEVRGHRQRPLLSRCPALDLVCAARHRAVLGRQGVKIFRVDNPHTKPVPFWEWMIREVQDRHPDVIFLSEAFTRPKMMRRLAKVGFTQSYSYFTWRNRKAELIEYLTELTRTESRLYMRPNFFANTPDINPVYLQTGGRPGFQVRLVLAALLSTSYGLYNGFEICEATPFPARRSISIRRSSRSGPGTSTARPHQGRHPADQPPAPGQPGPVAVHQPDVPQRLERQHPGLLQDHAGARQLHRRRRQPRSAQRPWGRFEVPLWEFGLPDMHPSTPSTSPPAGADLDRQDPARRLDPAERPYAIWRLVPPPDRRLTRWPPTGTIPSGTRTPSSISCTSRRSSIPTMTAWATSPA